MQTGDPRWRPYLPLTLLVFVVVVLGLAAQGGAPVHAQACPPYCQTPVITPAWHLHMCDEPYQEQLDDNHCMRGPGVTEFPAGTSRVYIIYCHQLSDTVVVQVKDSGGGLQFVNHPDGITYSGNGCETLIYQHPNQIPPAGSPYYTSAWWPEGPFTGVGAGIEWYIGLFLAFDHETYYGNSAEAYLTARDPAANADPTVREVITVQVSSTSDPTGIAMALREQSPGSSVFKSDTPLRFSQFASNAAQGVIRVANRDVITARYCPRSCTTPYVDTATWYQLEVTITPTPLPTWEGPPPTPTNTPPPDLPVQYMTLRPAPADVGYAPQIGSNKDRPNHLGYPTIYAGMWTHGRNLHHGMVQFDLSDLPPGAIVREGRLDLVGRESRYTKPGAWAIQLLDASIDAGWRDASYERVHSTTVLERLEPVLQDHDLGVGRRNSFGLSAAAVGHLNARLATTRRASFRADGPAGEDNNLFAWESGVDVYNRATEPPDPALGPALHLAYVVVPEATPTPLATTPLASPGTTASATPTAPTPILPTAGASTSPTVTRTPTVGASGTPAAPPTPGPGTPSASPTPASTAAVVATPTATGPANQRQVCVVAFDDRDGDGRLGPGERFLAGVTLRLTHVRTGVFDSWTTDGANDPDYCWNGLIDGPYTLKAVSLPRGHVGSGVLEHAFEVPFPGAPARYTFGARRPEVPTPTPTPMPTRPPTPTPSPTLSPTPSPEPTVDGPSGEICLGVFDDRNHDGARAAGEPWLEGMRVRVLAEDRQEVRVLASRSDGPRCTRLAAGVYYAGIAAPEGWIVITPREEAVLLTDGVRRTVVFGVYRPGGVWRAFMPWARRDVLRPRGGR